MPRMNVPATPFPTLAEIEAAHMRIAQHVRRTPILRSEDLDAIAGARLVFKCENFQRIGAFKARGAFNAILSLPGEAAARGVVTHSSGNHALAVALAARTRGVPATIVMPRTAPAAKRAGVERLGARIIEVEPTLAAREGAAKAVTAETGAAFVHPYGDPAVIAGQGTAAVELLEDVDSPLDVITCPVGGGGLLGGTCIAAASLSPGTRVIATEPEAADDAARGFRSGILQPQVLPVATLCDGLTTAMSPLSFAIMRAHAHDVVTVPEDAIVHAMQLVFRHLKCVIEPSCAVPLAAILNRAWDARGLTVGIILTGGNVDLERLPWMD
jgi:threonine dehydratase